MNAIYAPLDLASPGNEATLDCVYWSLSIAGQGCTLYFHSLGYFKQYQGLESVWPCVKVFHYYKSHTWSKMCGSIHTVGFKFGFSIRGCMRQGLVPRLFTT